MYFYNRLIKKLFPRNAWSTFFKPGFIKPLAYLYLALEHHHLIKHNLHSTYKTFPKGKLVKDDTQNRSVDGSGNDLNDPLMGSAGTRFGRNFPIDKLIPLDNCKILEPHPRIISEKLLARKKFIPAKRLNLLAAAWIQFMVHDWFSIHKLNKKEDWQIPLEETDTFPEKPMIVEKTEGDINQEDPRFIAYANTNSHWWDGAQIYGSHEDRLKTLRSFQDGKLKIQDNGLLHLDTTNGIDLTGVQDNWWIGLSILHTLFVREHNAICDKLKQTHPDFTDEKLFQKARLVNSALMAKIHTLEWTPGILNKPIAKTVLFGTWYGWLGKRIKKIIKLPFYALSGMVGNKLRHFGVPYSITEEFIAVYRMHSLMPDAFHIYSFSTGKKLDVIEMMQIVHEHSRGVLERFNFEDLFYSMGINHPGALCLHNYPNFLRELKRTDGKIIDLATIDVLRDRERQIPRYNEFRRLLDLIPAKSFEDLTQDKSVAQELSAVYETIEDVDLLVGCLAEKFPYGYGFGDTAFQIFILMASRRFMSDRFFTTDYRPEVYTQEGLDWVEESDMKTVCLRHFPKLKPALEGISNPFAPWKQTEKKEFL